MIPDPKVIVAQGAIFLTSVYVVKKLFVDPYLHLVQRRESLTTGSQNYAESLRKELAEKSKKIDLELKNAYQEASNLKAKAKKAAVEQTESQVSKVSSEVKDFIDGYRKEVASELSTEMSKVPGAVAELAPSLYSKTME